MPQTGPPGGLAGAPKDFQKNVVQMDSHRRTGPAFCHALYRTRCFISPRPVFWTGPRVPRGIQKNVVQTDSRRRAGAALRPAL